MQKPILYCDCDGVIFNTIEVAFDIMKKDHCDMNNGNEIDYYFREKINWQDIFDKAVIINRSIDRIKELKKSDLFSDVIILTKISGNYDEERLKREIFKDYLPDVKVITLQFGLQKASIISNPENHILVDDEKRNCINWQQYNGTAVLFSPSQSDLKNNIVNDLIDIPNTKGYKKLLKTRKI